LKRSFAKFFDKDGKACFAQVAGEQARLFVRLVVWAQIVSCTQA